MDIIERLRAILGPTQVLTGADCAPWASDWTGNFSGQPLAVLRPTSTAEVSAVMALAFETGTPVVPVSGNTGLAGGTHAPGQLVLSLDRMHAIREIRQASHVAVVEAGVVLSALHDAAGEKGLVFPVTFGARGSAMIGGILATNAGGSNVVRFGNTRTQVLGIEVVLPTGEVLDLMSELRKDNSGFDLRDLFIGAEGTLGIITAAVLALVPKPRAYATAMVALSALGDALTLLRRLQEATSGAVEAFEYMPANYIDEHMAHDPKARAPFDQRHDVNIMVEIGASAPRDCELNADGSLPIVETLEGILGEMIQSGHVLDAVVARTEGQRTEMWARREAAAELSVAHPRLILFDVALPLDDVETFLTRADETLNAMDPGVRSLVVSHLGDGNVHLTVWLTEDGIKRSDEIYARVEEIVVDLRGSFSAEHGIGLAKLATMAEHKNPVALDVMRRIKAALDTKGIMNPGKVVP